MPLFLRQERVLEKAAKNFRSKFLGNLVKNYEKYLTAFPGRRKFGHDFALVCLEHPFGPLNPELG